MLINIVMNYSDGVVRRAVRVWLGWRQQINSKQKQTKTKKCDHEKGYIKAGVYKNMALPLMKVISDAWMGNWEENQLGSIRTQHRHGHTHTKTEYTALFFWVEGGK